MISVTVLTKNSEKRLHKVLKALSSFDEVLVGDTGSTDGTLEIAKSYPNVRIEKLPFVGFGKTHNDLAKLAKYDWIFSVDSDEVAEPELIAEIQGLKLESGKVYSVPRKNYYKGVWIKTCGWYPDRVSRIYNRKETQFSEKLVHEAIENKNSVALQGHLVHYPYEKVADFLNKMQLYSELYAKDNKGKKASYLTAVNHGVFAFFRSYILKRGVLQNGPGLEISVYNAVSAFYKYLKLQEINKN